MRARSAVAPRRCSARSLPCARRAGAVLSDQADHPGRAVPARRRQRRAGAHRRRADEPHARPAGGGRKPRRRRRHGRHARGRQGRARRLHHPAVLHRHLRDQSDASIPMPATTRARISRPIGMIGPLPSVLVVHPSLPARIGRRADRLRQGQSRQDQLRLRARHGRPHHHRAVRQGPPASSITSIPYKGNGDAHRRPDRRPRLDDVPFDRAGHRATCRGGKLHALAVTTAERSPLLPDVPTDRGIGVARVLGRDQLRARWRRPARRARSSRGSTRSFARRWPTRSCRRSSPAKAPRRSRARPRNMPPRSTPKKTNGRRSSKAST